ncbi:dormancy-associated protein [Canna indica]|uniref:Dormancy-associated protein n=1 Tax=Canna indica TaxID=4628 RepID=A0AAQ3QD42_9LILI|nr:dormancy-associated protein [Canna indica]
MGLLDQLWDDTLAGPPPLGKLRKYNSFSPSRSASAAAADGGGLPQVTRSITILRPTPGSSAPSSPRSPSSTASAPDSPLARHSAAEGRLEEAGEEAGAGFGDDRAKNNPQLLRLVCLLSVPL